MSTWHSNRRRSRSRPRARGPAPGSRIRGVEYVSAAYAPQQQYAGDGSSSDYSDDSYDSRPPSIHIPSNGGHPRRRPGIRMPQAPAAPESPTTPSLRSGASDSPSSRASSGLYHDYSTLSPQSEPEILDHGYRYTGAYTYANQGDYHERFTVPQPPALKAWTAPPPVPVPAIPNCIIADPEDCGVPSPTSPTNRGGGPKAFSYLDANAPPPEPEVRVKEGCGSPGPTKIEAQMVFPVMYPQQYTHHHHHRHQQYRHSPAPPPPPSAPRSEWDDDYEDEEYRYVRRSRPRGGVRHIPIERETRPRSRSRSRGAPRSGSRPRSHYDYEAHDMENRPRRSGHHHSNHRSRSRPRSGPPGEQEKRSAVLQAQIDALNMRLSNIMDDPYARDVMAEEGIKFENLFPKEAGKS